jgi:hypothetical protein
MNQLLGKLKRPGRIAGALLATGLLAVAQGAVARPGTVNYAEGQVTLNGRTIGAKALGQTEIQPGRVLETQNGRAEVLLTPGAFLRVGKNSAVRMISPSITDTRVELMRGKAMVEVAHLEKENRIRVVDNGVDTRLEKKGIYEFNANQPTVAVYDGKAVVQQDDRKVDVKKGKELALEAGARLKPQKFDRNETDSLYNWSKLRSSYLAEANMSSAQMVVVNDYPGWWAGTGWYWNPWFSTWAFVPGNGFFNDPFGYGFYSPAYWYYNAPLYYSPGRVWVHRPVGRFGGGRFGGGGRAGVIARPPASAVGGSGLTFGRPAAPRAAMPSAPVMRPSAPSMGGRAMGGSGLRFGGGRRR